MRKRRIKLLNDMYYCLSYKIVKEQIILAKQNYMIKYFINY
jgi:hypothetical protein